MGRGKQAQDAREVLFKRLFGVKPETFEKMKSILQKEFNRLHWQGGSPPKLSVEDKLMIALKYLREYRTMESIGHDYGVSKSTVCETIQWVENALAKDKTFNLPGRKVLKEADDTIRYVGGRCDRKSHTTSKKNRKEYYSGKKKRHTLKTQVIINRKSREILDVQEAKGSVHDFKVFKDTIGTAIDPSILIHADPGYLGIEKLHGNSRIPSRRHLSRMSLICGIINLELRD
jgi:hypothetical protein